MANCAWCGIDISEQFLGQPYGWFNSYWENGRLCCTPDDPSLPRSAKIEILYCPKCPVILKRIVGLYRDGRLGVDLDLKETIKVVVAGGIEFKMEADKQDND